MIFCIQFNWYIYHDNAKTQGLPPADTMQFKDYFSNGSEEYRLYRPEYPDDLFAWLASLSAEKKLAWDCATGNGQAARQLAAYYDEVIATDGSKQQISHAEPTNNIRYHVARETNPLVPDASVDLVTVAQAIHWFDTDIFFDEVTRVLKPGGVLAFWGYNLLTISPEIDVIINRLYWQTLNGYWPAERKILEAGYQSFKLPFPETTALAFDMKQKWSLEQLLGYLNTWSAVKRYQADTQINPLDSAAKSLHAAWGSDAPKTVNWPLSIRVCQATGG
jgi:ubiquinone/menaquinone biosynthesis C-methylase UbiE